MSSKKKGKKQDDLLPPKIKQGLSVADGKRDPLSPTVRFMDVHVRIAMPGGFATGDPDPQDIEEAVTDAIENDSKLEGCRVSEYSMIRRTFKEKVD